MRAGACMVAAWKRLGLSRSKGAGLGPLLAAAGIGLSSAYNAAVRAGLIAERGRLQKDAATATVA
jgi:hypothetical protein